VIKNKREMPEGSQFHTEGTANLLMCCIW